MTEIRAAVCTEFGTPLEIETLNLRAPERSEVQVQLAACAICHSDITYMDGGWGGNLPAVYGHEAAGVIRALGPEVRGLNIGDPVVVTLIAPCGQCPTCHSGRPTICQNSPDMPAKLTRADGSPVVAAMNCGAFAEAVVVEQAQVVKLPRSVDLVTASLLACGVITGVGAVVNSAELRPGQDVVVIGAGGVGLNAIQGARIAGARRIVAVDLSDAKREAALEFGATDFVPAGGDAPWEAVREILGKGADAVFVSVGIGPVYDTAPNYLGPDGKLVMVGIPHSGVRSEYEAANIGHYGQKLIGSKMGDAVISRDIPWMVDLYEQGRLKLDELVSNTWSLEEINEAITSTRGGADRRNVVKF